jgi:PhzF family phenazine biosynthesis protein
MSFTTPSAVTPTADSATVITVFAAGRGGGNPAPIVADASALTDEDMRSVASGYGMECGFVLPRSAESDCDLRLRFWVPNHEMSMCGHATVAALWLLDGRGAGLPEEVRVQTASGVVRARVKSQGPQDRRVEVAQSRREVEPIGGDVLAEIAAVLGAPVVGPVLNASTSRVKTLIALPDPDMLNALSPDFALVAQLCGTLGSTGLYPYAPNPCIPGTFHARQFPRSSGYPEDAATGIAATALACGLQYLDQTDATSPIVVRQGEAMGRPSAMTVRFDPDDGSTCWLSGEVGFADDAS